MIFIRAGNVLLKILESAIYNLCSVFICAEKWVWNTHVTIPRGRRSSFTDVPKNVYVHIEGKGSEM